MTLFGLLMLLMLLIAVVAALHQLLVLVLAATLACVVVRFAWVFLSIHTPVVQRRLHAATAKARRKKPFVVAWAALRGADSLVIALAIPLTIRGGAPFPSRDLIIFVTFGVIFMTLVVQGFSLASPAHGISTAEADRETDARVRDSHELLASGDDVATDPEEERGEAPG